ncbi:hypothetical protein J7400_20835 [Shimia sp. R9_2]|uniref:hypothetical protein n=1 Tax=Shimia sp. R9_2 TaxID=2821112 RepID=UPI001ADAB7A6|nr:hypothetical protein [Shimia sp. R9_2]MBO9399129.1 hypothetical protein [Shimia sp. R9_2]
MNDSERILYRDFKDDDLKLFGKDVGITINTTLNRVILFHGPSFQKQTLLQISDMRSIEWTIPEAVQHYSIGNRGAADAIGQSIGRAFLNSHQRHKARKGMGIELCLRSLEHPVVFFNIQDETILRRTYEALNQIMEDHSLDQEMGTIPSHVLKHYSHTLDEIEREKQKVKERHAKNWKKSFVIGAAVCVAVLICVTAINFADAVKHNRAKAFYIDTVQNRRVAEVLNSPDCDKLFFGLESFNSDTRMSPNLLITRPVRGGSDATSILAGDIVQLVPGDLASGSKAVNFKWVYQYAEDRRRAIVVRLEDNSAFEEIPKIRCD